MSPPGNALRVEFCRELAAVPAAAWDALTAAQEPFLRHAFLAGLETHGCLGREFGWFPCHVLVYADAADEAMLAAAMPLYAKSNNYGEFVFDWAWQSAWERNGLAYYPKFVSSVPYTPATGPRLLVHPGFVEHADRLRRLLLRSATEFALRHQASGVHVLFPAAEEQRFIEALDDPIEVEIEVREPDESSTTRDESADAPPADVQTPEERVRASRHSKSTADSPDAASEQTPPAVSRQMHVVDRWVARHGCQYHWHNDGYADFEAFLKALSSKKRKNIRRERRLAADSGLEFVVRHGDEATAAEWAGFHRFYVDTFERHMGMPTLSEAFFRESARTLGRQVLLIEAIDPAVTDPARRIVAAALCYRSATTLYGRFWGCREQVGDLHFEVCYYQGIDYCIREGLKRFEPGAQGEHKIARGFLPTVTHSAHRVLTPGFAPAVEAFCERERDMLRQQCAALWSHSPFVAERLPAAVQQPAASVSADAANTGTRDAARSASGRSE